MQSLLMHWTSVRRRLPLVARVVLAGLACVLAGCPADDPASPPVTDSGKITSGPLRQLTSTTIPASGGEVTVAGSGTALDGLELAVPAGAYAEPISVTIASAEITAHAFGALFDPVTPLLHIENGGGFATVPMRLRIPLPPLGTRFAMACYYNRAAGTLEALTPLARGDDWIEVAVRHFSEIVVTATETATLESGSVSTGFAPDRNGWSFVNYGDYAEPRGMCAGMCIGATYFFTSNANVSIATLFDNDAYWFRTPKVWQDDAKGIRFCSELQRTYVTTNNVWLLGPQSLLDPIFGRSEEDHFRSLVYALRVTGKPQLLYIDVRGNSSAVAHAITAFGCEITGSEARIRIYDPNYPRIETSLVYDLAAQQFRPYTSAGNASALEDGQTYSYDRIIFIPLSTLCDMRDIAALWTRATTGALSTARYPECEYWAVPVGNDQLPRVRLMDATTGRTTYLPYSTFSVEVVPKDPSIPCSLVGWADLPSIGEIEKHDPIVSVTLDRPGGDNLFGVELNALAQGRSTPSWAGFTWFKIRMQTVWIEPADTVVGVQQELRLVARHNGTAPAGARFVWTFGDGKSETVTGDSTVTHVWDAAKSYTVSVEVRAPSGSDVIGRAEAAVDVVLFRSMAVMLMGMDATPPSTIKATGGVDIENIGWSNRIGQSPPPLTWKDKEFEVEYSFRLSQVDYTTRISGRIADDGKTIAVLTAITSGTGFAGAFTYTGAIAVTAMPISASGGSAPMGGEVQAGAARACVSNLSWRQTSVDGQGNTHVVELESVDWSSSKTRLSVYFYR